MIASNFRGFLITFFVVASETILKPSIPIVNSFSFTSVVVPTFTSSSTSSTTTIQANSRISTTQTKMSTFSEEKETDTTSSSTELPEPSSMRIRAIKDELNSMNIDYTDCFDKESLCTRLVDARSGAVKGASSSSSTKTESQSTPASETPSTGSSLSTSNFDKEKKLEELRSLRVKELRTRCAQNNIRWAHMIEKEELVQALIGHYEKASLFSPSGTLTPGKVTMITDDDVLEKEIYNGGVATTPLMLDVFATWCGPCKMMAPLLDEAAIELGDTVRVAKIDSDQHPEWSSKLNVRGLPSIIVFDGKTGKELQRVEGALMKDDLVKLARSHI